MFRVSVVEKDRTCIGKDTTFHGTIHTQKLTVAGKVEGNVKAQSDVIIKDGAFIDGPIETKSINFEEGGFHQGLINLGNLSGAEKNSLFPFYLPYDLSRSFLLGSITVFIYCRAFVHGMKEVFEVEKA